VVGEIGGEMCKILEEWNCLYWMYQHTKMVVVVGVIVRRRRRYFWKV